MRAYAIDLPGGTATNSVQIQAAGTLKNIALSIHSAAAGKVEVSRSATSQIGTAQPTKDVIARANQSGTAGDQDIVFDFPSKFPEVTFKAFDLLYIHQTGAGNLGSVSFVV